MDNLALSYGGNLCFTAVGSVAATTTSKYKTANAATYTIAGRFYSKSGTDNVTIVTTGFAQHKALTSRIYGVYLDSGGNFSFVQGPAAVTADVVAGTAALQWPTPIKDKVMVGAFQVRLTSGADFVPATDALTTSGNRTVTFYDTCGTPTVPITA